MVSQDSTPARFWRTSLSSVEIWSARSASSDAAGSFSAILPLAMCLPAPLLILLLIAPQIAPFALPGVIPIDHNYRNLLRIRELDRPEHGIMYWDLGGREICWHAIRRRVLRAVHNSDLTVALLDQVQDDGVRLKFIYLF